MKTLSLTLAAIIAGTLSLHAQWTTSGSTIFNDNSGNVGINTATPKARLSIGGTLLIGGGFGNLDPNYTPNDFSYLANTGQMLIGFNRTGGEGETDFINNKGGGAYGGFSFYEYGNDNTLNHLVRIKGNGNVGLGTTSPLATLHVRGTSNSLTGGRNALLLDNGNASGNRSSEIIWSANGAPKWEMGNDFAANGEQSFYLFDLENTANPSFLVNSHGNVGIGTNDPKGYKLAVAGSVIAESVTVKMQNIWPDYVFNPDYHLPSLTELKTYIDQNNHLPDMPSAATVAKEGVNLGEINSLLMKKIEELTLYLIEKDKQLKNQEERIKKLEEKSK